ncbi:MAG TPA: RibD family protein [Thermoanaerobaculia bacterium]|nr:RibD family protein [Thermoanaerobaculia bacterium]
MSLSLLTAVSLNGVITPARGESADALIPLLDPPRGVLEWKHEVRRRHGAVLVGTNTVLVDDPTLQSHAVPGFDPVRVTVDPGGRIPRKARFFDGSARTLVGVTSGTPRGYLDFLAERGVETVPCGDGPRCDLRALLEGLTGRGIADVVCEGGGTLNGALLAAGLVDRVYLVVMPVVLDPGSVRIFEGVGGMERFRMTGVERVGDYLMVGYGR